MGTEMDIETAYKGIVEEGIDPITNASFASIPQGRREYLVHNMATVISRLSCPTESDAIDIIEKKIGENEKMAKQPNACEEPHNPDIYEMLRTALDTGAYKVSKNYKPKFV